MSVFRSLFADDADGEAASGRHLQRHTAVGGHFDHFALVVAGGAVGFATGVILIALILIGIEWVSPITYSPLGWLSPERVSNTMLLAGLIDVLPVAI